MEASRSKAERVTKGVALRAIASDIRALSDAIVESGGEITPEVQAAYEKLEGEREEKIEGLSIVWRNLLGHAEQARVEEEWYHARKTVLRKAADRLRALAHDAMRAAPFPLVRVQTGRVNAWRQRNSTPEFSCDEDRAHELPHELRKTVCRSCGSRDGMVTLVSSGACVKLWRPAFDQLVEERTALMTKDEKAEWILVNLQPLAEEAARATLPPFVRVKYEEHLRL